MGLDIYAGTLTRYYAHNWNCAPGRRAVGCGSAASEGVEFNAQGQQTPAGLRAAMEEWQDQTLTALTRPGQALFAPWPEGEEIPCCVHQPGRDALGALLLTAACHIYGAPVPPTVERGWDFMAHPLIIRLCEDHERVWSLFRGATWWLPVPESVLFQATLPRGEMAIIGTLGGLCGELEALNQLIWQADEDTILSWSQEDSSAAGGRETLRLAQRAFSALWLAMRFAQSHQVPILLNFLSEPQAGHFPSAVL